MIASERHVANSTCRRRPATEVSQIGLTQTRSSPGNPGRFNELLACADNQRLGEQRLDRLAVPTHESGDGGEVRLAVTARHHELYVLAARRGDGTRADHAAAVAEQDDLEQYRRVVGRNARGVVAVGLDERGKIGFVVHQHAYRVLECAGQKLGAHRALVHGQQRRDLKPQWPHRSAGPRRRAGVRRCSTTRPTYRPAHGWSAGPCR